MHCDSLVLAVFIGLGTACATAGTAPESPDAEPGPPTVMSDAAVIEMPDALPDAAPPADAPCTDVLVQLLSNPSFDIGAGNGWVEASTQRVVTSSSLSITPHSGSYVAWLGGLISSTDALHQSVTIPEGARSLQLTGYRQIQSDETASTPYDRLTVSLRDGASGLLEVLGTYSNTDKNGSWAQFAFTSTNHYAGETIRLHLESVTDGSKNTNFYFDTLALTALICR